MSLLLCCQDDIRVIGSWSDRHVLLFHRALLLTKKLKDGSLQTKAFLDVSTGLMSFTIRCLEALYFLVVHMSICVCVPKGYEHVIF